MVFGDILMYLCMLSDYLIGVRVAVRVSVCVCLRVPLRAPSCFPLSHHRRHRRVAEFGVMYKVREVIVLGHHSSFVEKSVEPVNYG